MLLAIVVVLGALPLEPGRLVDSSRPASQLRLLTEASPPTEGFGGWSQDQLLAEQTRLTQLLAPRRRTLPIALLISGGAATLLGGVEIAVMSYLAFGPGLFAAATPGLGAFIWLAGVVVGGLLVISGVVLLIVGAVNLTKQSRAQADVELRLRRVNEQLDQPSRNSRVPPGVNGWGSSTVAQF